MFLSLQVQHLRTPLDLERKKVFTLSRTVFTDVAPIFVCNSNSCLCEHLNVFQSRLAREDPNSCVCENERQRAYIKNGRVFGHSCKKCTNKSITSTSCVNSFHWESIYLSFKILHSNNISNINSLNYNMKS